MRLHATLLGALLLAAPALARAEAPPADATAEAAPAPPVADATPAPPAEPEPAATPPAEPEAPTEASPALGLNVDLGYATSYILRGYNVFQSDGQSDAHMLLAPGVLWTVPDTTFAVGYLGFFQLNGDNLGALIDAGLGAEQDLYVSWVHPVAESLSLTVGATAYLYPFADEAIVGASCPFYFEPMARLTYASVVDLGLAVHYFLGIQDEPAIRGLSYLYVNPTVSKTLALTEKIGLSLRASYGFKLFKEGNDGMSNVHDLLLAATLPITLGGGAYVTPGLSAAWTNIEGGDFADGLAVVGALNFGVNL